VALTRDFVLRDEGIDRLDELEGKKADFGGSHLDGSHPPTGSEKDPAPKNPQNKRVF